MYIYFKSKYKILLTFKKIDTIIPTFKQTNKLFIISYTYSILI